jgi:hypothetical protein
MRRATLTTALAGLLAVGLGAANGPSISGAYVEARTAEIFTGGCIMNGEAATVGKEALMAWKVDRGSFKGVPLDGLMVVAAVAGDVNLSIREIGGDTAVTKTALFVDNRATGAQRDALVAMAKQLSNGVIEQVVQLTPTKIQFADEAGAVRVAAADTLRLTVAKQISHDATCGGKQWFHPFATVDGAEMGTASENVFTGTALGTKWSDPNKRSGFFGTFSY